MTRPPHSVQIWQKMVEVGGGGIKTPPPTKKNLGLKGTQYYNNLVFEPQNWCFKKNKMATKNKMAANFSQLTVLVISCKPIDWSFPFFHQNMKKIVFIYLASLKDGGDKQNGGNLNIGNVSPIYLLNQLTDFYTFCIKKVQTEVHHASPKSCSNVTSPSRR